MTQKTVDKRYDAIVERRKEMERDYLRIFTELKDAEAESAERILDGASIDAEEKRISEQIRKRDRMASALELAKARELQAKDTIYQKRLEASWAKARLIWTRNFKTVDALTISASKLLNEREGLQAAVQELGKLGGEFARTQPSLFGPEIRILQSTIYMLDVLGARLEQLEATRMNYDRSYTDERQKG
jgi:hypothetical protein